MSNNSLEIRDQINNTTAQLNNAINKSKIFDPRKITEEEDKRLWSTESVELAYKGLAEGYELSETPFNKNIKDYFLRKPNLPFKYTEDELKVIKICRQNKILFGNNFTRLKDGDAGWKNIKLRDYQEKLLNQYTNTRWNILLFPRQSGKTTTTIIEIVHFLTFNIDKDCVVVAQSETVVDEILSKIKECFSGLPFFLQPGFKKFTKGGLELDNGCRLKVGVASESVVQGFSLDLLFVDEFAYIKESVAKSFWINVYPALSNNPKSRCIIASTPNGRNFFYDIWKGALEKTNTFTPYRIYWYDVPGRDESFKTETIKNIGLEGWEMGYECSFDTKLKSLFKLNTQKLLRLQQNNYESSWKTENSVLGLLGYFCIDREIIDYDLKEDFYLMGVDIGEGLDQDYSVIKIRKIFWNKELKRLEFKTVAIYHSNQISVEDFAELILKTTKLFNQENIKVIVENNNYGGELFSNIDKLKLYDQRYYAISNDIFAKFYRASKEDFERGIRWNRENKKMAVKSFSSLVNDNILQETYYKAIEEYLNFGKSDKNDTYAAQYGHDDLVMSDVTISAYIKALDIYSKEFFKTVEGILRFRYNDESVEVILERELKIKKENSIYKRDSWVLHDSEEILNSEVNKNLLIF